jgi:hypothetical protein
MRETILKYAGNRNNHQLNSTYLSNMISGLVFVE